MKLINKNQPVKLSDGRPARILGEISNGGQFLLVVAFKKGDALGSELVGLFRYDGGAEFAASERLVNTPKQITTVTRYAYVFEDSYFFTAKVPDYPDLQYRKQRHGELVAIVPVTLTVTEGEGL